MVKKTDYNTKISEIEKKPTDHNHDKYITTPEFNKLIGENFAARLKQANLITKADFGDELKSLKYKINTKKSKKTFTRWKWVWKAENIRFKLFCWQNSFWRKCNTKLFRISVNIQIFWTS